MWHSRAAWALALIGLCQARPRFAGFPPIVAAVCLKEKKISLICKAVLGSAARGRITKPYCVFFFFCCLFGQEECQNYIRVLLVNGNRLFTCGTNAFTPICTNRTVRRPFFPWASPSLFFFSLFFFSCYSFVYMNGAVTPKLRPRLLINSTCHFSQGNGMYLLWAQTFLSWLYRHRRRFSHTDLC